MTRQRLQRLTWEYIHFVKFYGILRRFCDPQDNFFLYLIFFQVDFSSEAQVETSDDILAKYRKRPPATLSANSTEDDLLASGELSTSNEVILHEGNRSQDDIDYSNEDVDSRLVIDPHNIEASYAFQVLIKWISKMNYSANVIKICFFTMYVIGYDYVFFFLNF